MGKKTIMVSNNVRGSLAALSHHCSECKGPITGRCYKNLHMAYCTARDDNDQACGTRFSVISPGGCHYHPYSEGHNKDVVNIRRGLSPDFKTTYELQKEAEAKAQEEQETKAREEDLANRPYDKDWTKPEFREKRAPQEKKKDKQGKKQPMTMDLKDLKKRKSN